MTKKGRNKENEKRWRKLMKKDKIKIMVIEDFINLNLLSNFISLRTSLPLNTLKIYLIFFLSHKMSLKKNCEKVRKKIVFLLLFLLSVLSVCTKKIINHTLISFLTIVRYKLLLKLYKIEFNAPEGNVYA